LGIISLPEADAPAITQINRRENLHVAVNPPAGSLAGASG